MSILNAKSVMNLNSILEVNRLFEIAKQKGYSFAAITNDGNLSNLFDVSEAAKATGLKPIAGCRLPFRIGENVVHLALYPRNNRAKKMLNALSTKYYKNEMKNLGLEGMKNILTEMSIVIDSNEITSKVVREVIKTLTTFLEKNIIYVGLQETFDQINKEKNLEIKNVITEEGIKYIPFNEIKFLNEDELETFNYFSQMKSFEELEDMDNMLMTKSEINEIFDYMGETSDSTQELVSQIKANFIIEQEEIRLPSYPVPSEFKIPEKFSNHLKEYIVKTPENQVRSAAYLWHLVFEGLVKKYNINNETIASDPIVQEAIKRAIKELKVTITMGFSNYFLIVWDFMDYAIKTGILTGPGRGSVVGSILAYSLNITSVCPLKYKLQFERFLHADRKGLPDIDIDVDTEKREELIKYLYKKYGKTNVAHILTKSSYGFKHALEGILKTTRVPQGTVDEMMNYSPHKYDSLEELCVNEPEIQSLMKKSRDVRVLLKECFALKSVPKGLSTHAAGIVISDDSLENGDLPMMYDSNNNLITQIVNDTSKNTLEKMGKPKFDLLGLLNLTVLDNVGSLIFKNHNIKINELDLPLDDEKTLQLISEAKHMEGIFQLESDAAKKIIKEIGVKTFSDVYLVNAFNRPGPNEFASVYAQREGQPTKIFSENGEELNLVEDLYPILEDTRGIIVYQEQINEIAAIWAGYTMEEADVFRRAVSKKDLNSLNKEGNVFLKKSIEQGRNEQTTNELFAIILRFAKYGFNKSHAVAYSLITYKLAYLKAHYPLEFWAGLLSTVAHKTEKVAKYISEARNMGVSVLPPDINLSTDKFVIEGNSVRCALQMVNGLGEKTAKAIVEARDEKPFSHIYTLLKRINSVPNVGNADIELLAKVGALDTFGERHLVISEINPKYSKNEPLTIGEKAMLEIEYCKTIFSVEGEYRIKLEEATLQKENYVAAVIKSVHKKYDKYEREMAKIELVSINGERYEPVIFAKLWKKVKKDVSVGSIVLAEINESAKGSLYYGNIQKITTVNV